ncbi:MAG: helix-turn-helix domain-containing protein [Acidimicrobiia bacterium]
MPRPSPQTDRVVAVLNLLGHETDGLTGADIARRVGANRASCVHMLAALEGAGFVTRGALDRRYRLGPALVELGAAAARSYPGLEAARRELDGLTRATGHPGFVFAREGDLARLLGFTWDLRRAAPVMRTGDTLVLAPPLGAVFYAWASAADVDAWLGRAPSGADAAELRDLLGAVRRLGFAVELLPEQLANLAVGGAAPDPSGFVARDIVDDEPYTVSSVSVPVFATDGTVALALNLAGFAAPLLGREIRALADDLLAAAARCAG